VSIERVSSVEARARLGASQLAAGLSDSHSAFTLLQESAGQVRGALQLEVLGFDSELFGAPSSRINVFGAEDAAGYVELIEACQRECAERGVRHAVRRMPVGQFAETWALEQAGYRLVDMSVLFERDAVAPTSVDASLRPVAAGEDERLSQQFAEVFTLTRFAVDPFVSSAAAAELHRRWIKNSCNGRADAVLVCALGDALAGFVTCRVDAARATGTIELIAVDPAQRGAGVGRKLMAGAQAWFSSRVQRIHVRTQVNNALAIGLYQACGFQLRLGETTYAWMARESSGT
jgi:ribosomal protein S18 acetylase RimI-like enzyme